MEKEEFLKKFNECVLIPLQKTCSLLDIRPHINYMDEDFSTIINVVLFYTGYSDIKSDSDLFNVYNFQMEIATAKLKEFYKDFIKHLFNSEIDEHIKENTDISFFRVSDMNYNTAIFFGGDNFDGFNITYTDE
jgi:hypothetical protein